ncbi:hypothetical protein KUCAC02_028827, partial [Chaenocephalus aceratus]
RRGFCFDPEPHCGPVGGSAVMASHCPSSPGFQLHSSHLFQGQQEAVSAASPNLRAAVFFSCYSQSPEHLPQRSWILKINYLLSHQAEHEPKTPVRESDRRDWNLFRVRVFGPGTCRTAKDAWPGANYPIAAL